jgi:hypothetical protein
MKKMLLIMTMISICFAASAVKADVTVDATYMTKYLWHGIDALDDTAAFAPSINFELGEGFYVGTMYVLPLTGGNSYDAIPRSDSDHWYYWAGYKGQAMVGESMQMDYDLSYTYYDIGTVRTIAAIMGTNYGKITGSDGDMQELSLDAKFPNMCEVLVPHYKVSYMFEAPGSDIGMWGFEQTVGLGYDFAVADMPMNATVDFVYDGGAITDKNDWTRMVAGLSTEMQLGNGKLVPAIYYQKPFLDGSTGPELDDDFYATLSYSFNF